jgi:hypothetical protein
MDDDTRTALAPEVQALLRHMDLALASIPSAHSERIVRELLADLHHKIAGIYQSTPPPSSSSSHDPHHLQEFRHELRDLELQRARLGISAPREIEARIHELLEAIGGIEQQTKLD